MSDTSARPPPPQYAGDPSTHAPSTTSPPTAGHITTPTTPPTNCCAGAGPLAPASDVASQVPMPANTRVPATATLVALTFSTLCVRSRRKSAGVAALPPTYANRPVGSTITDASLKVGPSVGSTSPTTTHAVSALMQASEAAERGGSATHTLPLPRDASIRFFAVPSTIRYTREARPVCAARNAEMPATSLILASLITSVRLAVAPVKSGAANPCAPVGGAASCAVPASSRTSTMAHPRITPSSTHETYKMDAGSSAATEGGTVPPPVAEVPCSGSVVMCIIGPITTSASRVRLEKMSSSSPGAGVAATDVMLPIACRHRLKEICRTTSEGLNDDTPANVFSCMLPYTDSSRSAICTE